MIVLRRPVHLIHFGSIVGEANDQRDPDFESFDDRFRRLLADTRAASAAEYTIILAVIGGGRALFAGTRQQHRLFDR